MYIQEVNLCYIFIFLKIIIGTFYSQLNTFAY